MSSVDQGSQAGVWDFLRKFGLAICCVIGPVALGYGGTNIVANALMPLTGEKPVFNFVFPDLEEDSIAKVKKAETLLAARKKTTSEKQGALDRLEQASAQQENQIKSVKSALEEAQNAEIAAQAEVARAERDRKSDQAVAQSKLIAETLTGRYSYAAVSGLLYLVSAATLLFGAVIVLQRSGRLLAIGLPVSVVLALLVAHYPTAYENVGRSFLVFLLDDSDKNTANFKPLFDAYKGGSFKVSGAIDLIVKLNTFVGLLAVGIALLAFAVLACREDPPTFTSLDERKKNLQRMLALSSAILVVSTFASKVLLDWPLNLVAPPQGEALKSLATALTTHLGMSGTVALFAAAVPALAAWYEDVKAYRLLTPAPVANAQKQDADKLEFGLSSAIASIIAILAPALTSPLFASFKAVVDMFPGSKAG